MIKWVLILLLSLGFNQADFNRDGCVDYQDLVIFSQEWLMGNYYLQFDGAGSSRIVSAPQFDAGIGETWAFTIEFIIRTPSDSSGGGTIFDAYDETVDLGILITCDSDGKPTIKLRSSLPSERTRTATGTFTAGTWYHCMFSRKASSGNWYINGEDRLDGTGAGPVSGDFATNKTFYFGVARHVTTGAFTNYYRGDVRNFGYYVGKELSQAEALARFNAIDFDGTEDGLSLAYNMNEGTGNRANDILGGESLRIQSLARTEWVEITAAEEERKLLQQKVAEAIKTLFDAASFTSLNNLYFEQAPQDAGLDYAVFHWIDSTPKHLMDSDLEYITIQFNLYMIQVDDIGTSVQELTDTFDWSTLTIPGYTFVKMEREFTRNVGLIDDVWQIAIGYEILVN